MHCDFTKLLSYRIINAEVRVKREILRCFTRLGYDITFEQWILLSTLYNHPGPIQSELADLTRKDRTNVTRILDVLGRKGYIRREAAPGDRRSYRIFLSNEGETLVRDLVPRILEINKSLQSPLTDEEAEAFFRALDKIGQVPNTPEGRDHD